MKNFLVRYSAIKNELFAVEFKLAKSKKFYNINRSESWHGCAVFFNVNATDAAEARAIVEKELIAVKLGTNGAALCLPARSWEVKKK